MVHRMNVKVRFYELDPYNHLNHSAYIQYFETARIELLEEVGFGMEAMKNAGLLIVVAEIRTRFLRSAEGGDELVVETSLAEFKRVSTAWYQRLLRGDEILAEQHARGAMTNLAGRPTRFPEGLIRALQAYAEAD